MEKTSSQRQSQREQGFQHELGSQTDEDSASQGGQRHGPVSDESLPRSREERSSEEQESHSGQHTCPQQNVGDAERLVSAASGAILALLGLGRRDLTGIAITGIGAALIFRGATGHCALYQALGQNTAACSTAGDFEAREFD